MHNSEVIDRLMMKIELKSSIKVSNQMSFISLIHDMGYREEKMWGEEDEHILHKLCKFANEHTKHQMELIEKYMGNFRIIEINEQGFPEKIEYKYKGKWMQYVNFNSETELKLNQYVKDNFNKTKNHEKRNRNN